MDESFKDALQRNIDKVGGSGLFVQIYHSDMANFAEDPWPAIQLAIAILLDKPILIAAVEGRELPPKLARIADRVLTGGPEGWARGLEEFVAERKIDE